MINVQKYTVVHETKELIEIIQNRLCFRKRRMPFTLAIPVLLTTTKPLWQFTKNIKVNIRCAFFAKLNLEGSL